MSELSRPTAEEWRALYTAADLFKRSACWEWMYDTDTFAVEDPETKEIAYVSIMGHAGEHFAIAGYLGAEGLDSLQKIVDGDFEASPEILFLQKCLMCSFEKQSTLTSDELKIIKSLELKFRGSHAWPHFRHFEPGLFPWFINAWQCRFLTHIINQALEVALCCRKTKRSLKFSTSDTYLVRKYATTTPRTGSWKDSQITPLPFVSHYPSFALTDEVGARRLATLKTNARLILEADSFYIPSPIREEGRPFYPKMCILIDHTNGMILSYELLPDYPQNGLKGVELLTRFIETNRAKPVKLLVMREETYYLYVKACKQLNIQLEMVDYLEFTEEARMGLMNSMMQ